MPALRKVLVISANPLWTPPIRINPEIKVIREALEGSPISFEFRVSATVQDLQRALIEEPYQLLHISSHGTANGSLELEDAKGERYVVPQEALANELNAYRAALQCVILNACFSSAQGKLISMGVPTTIAMEGKLGDAASIEFSRMFYRALAAGHDVAFAYARGCNAVALAAPNTEFMPVKLENPDQPAPSRAPSSEIAVDVYWLDTGERRTLRATPGMSVGALSAQAQALLGAAVTTPAMQWALIDGRLKEQWTKLSLPEKQRLCALVKTSAGVVPSYSSEDTLNDLGVEDGIVFFLVGRQNVVLSSGLSGGKAATHAIVDEEEVASRLDEYRQRVHAEYSDIRLDLTDETLRLDDSYIRLAVARQAPKARDEQQEPSRLELLEPEAANAKYRALWIEGEPGAGKTTLLYYLMRRLSAPDAGKLVPVYVSSKTLARADGGLAEAIRRSPAGCAPSDAPAWTFVVLVDGMDEAQLAAPILDYLNPLMLPRNVRVVATSRPVLQPPTPSAWVKMQIQPLSEDLITAFLRDRSADAIAERLPDEAHAGGILSVPLFLHIAAKTASRQAGQGRLTRVSLLGQLLDDVDEREAARGRGTSGRERAQLQSLAWEMRVAGARTSFDLRLAVRAGLNADDVTRVVRSGLVRREGADYTFAHLLIAEYLAARHLASQPASAFPAIVWQSWAPLFSTEVLPLACALWPDLDGFLQQVALQMPETAQIGRLRLLGRCLRERPATPDESAFARRVRAVVQAVAANVFVFDQSYSLSADKRELASFVGEPVLLDMLEHPDTCMLAVPALGHLKTSAALDRLRALALRPGDSSEVIEALEGIRPGAAFEILAARAADPDPDVRRMAAVMLGNFWHSPNAETLVRLSDDPDDQVRRSAIDQMDRPGVDDDGRRFRAILIEKLRDSERDVRLSAARVLARHDQSEHAQALFALLSDPLPGIREAGLRAIGSKTRHLDPSRITAALDDPALSVRLAAIELVDTADDATVARLLHSLEDPDEDVRHAASRVLHELNDDRLPDAMFSRAAMDQNAIYHVRSERAIPALVELLQDPRTASFDVAYGLIHIREANAPSEAVVSAVLPLLDSPNPQTRKLAIVAVHEGGSERLIAPLLRLLGDPVCGVDAGATLQRLASESMVDALIPLLDDPQAVSTVVNLLTTIGSPRAITATLPHIVLSTTDELMWYFYVENGSWARDAAVLAKVMKSRPEMFSWTEYKGGAVFPFPMSNPGLEPWKWSIFPAAFTLDDVAGTTMSFRYDDRARLDIRLGEHWFPEGGVFETPAVQLSPRTLRVFSDIATASAPDRWRAEPRPWLENVAPELSHGLAQLADDQLNHVYNFAMSGLYLMGLSRPGDKPLIAHYAANLGTVLQRSQTQLEQLIVRAWFMTCLSGVMNTADPWPIPRSIIEKSDDGKGMMTAYETYGVPALQALRHVRSSSVLHRVPFATWLRIVRMTAIDPPRQDAGRGVSMFVVDGVAPVAVARPSDIWSGLQTGWVPGGLKIAPIPNSPPEDIRPEFRKALEVLWFTVRNDYFDSLRVYQTIEAETTVKPDGPRTSSTGLGNAVRRLFGFGRNRN